MPLALVTQADGTIGTGHLVETIAIAAEAVARGLEPIVVVPPGAPEALLSRCPQPIERLPDLDPATLGALARALVARGVRAAVTNLRRVTPMQVAALRDAGLRAVCIDELGAPGVDCDAAINPTGFADPGAYGSRVPGFRLHVGVDYLVLGPEYRRLARDERSIRPRIEAVLIAMGGVDRSGATVRIAEALAVWRPEVMLHFVLGAGFGRAEGLTEAIAGRAHHQVHRGLMTLAPLMRESDVALTAGGNTLCELACTGTPAAVLFEDDHEARQGRAFESRGFGRVIGRGAELPLEAIREAVEAFDDPALRREQAEAGRRLVDGHGSARVFAVVQELVARDSAVAP